MTISPLIPNPQSLIPKVYKLLYKSYGPQHWWPGETPFEVIVGAILTQNTAWTSVEKAIQNLKKEKLLSVSALRAVPLAHLKKAIRPAGFFNQKSARLKTFVKYLDERYGGSLARFLKAPLPGIRHELLNINGIGPETADSILLYAAQKPVFVVDAYTRRIFSRMGLLNPRPDYEHVRDFFQKHIESLIPNPKSRIPYFNEYHALIVRHAKSHCRTRPLCDACPLNSVCKKCIITA